MGRFIVEHDRDEFRKALSELGPQGLAFPVEPGSVWQKLLRALGAEFAQFESDADGIVREWFPTLTTDLLEEWEAAVGLPDRCNPAGDSYEERIEALVAKLRLKYGGTPTFFVDFLKSIGWEDPSITEKRPARFTIAPDYDQVDVNYTAPERADYTFHMGEARFGPPELIYHWQANIEAVRGTYARFGETQFGYGRFITYTYSMHLESLADYEYTDADPRPLFGEAEFGDRFAQFIVGAEGPVRYARCGKNFGIRFRDWGDPVTECLMKRIKPAHTYLHFAYGATV